MELTTQNLEDRIEEKFQTSVEKGYGELDPESIPTELVREEDVVQIEQVEELLAERQQKLDKIGPVNFVALDEYDEKKTRLEFLEQQRDDLLKSREDLLQAIEKINRTARQLFRETFEQVRANFQEIFATLFEGGQADLIIHKSDDPLESDIEVMARPSGKRVDSVSLLSGGERALTAIALLFAVYLIKPSPFCILDEVDAPLDDMNVGRFVRLLERFAERTQFVVITHNKLTMESADHLYGVTMEESGVSRLVSVSFDELDTDDPLAALEEVAAEKREEKAHPESRLSPEHRVLVAEGGGDGASLPVEPGEEA
jgi:chromosome segregation protein